MATGSWTLTCELFERGDPAFLAELRTVHAPEQLGAFAAQWYQDKRPFARQTLFDYLNLPLNCYRHEPLVKRLYKLAEAQKDDELVGAFLVAFDRSIRRRRKSITRYKNEVFTSRTAAEVAVRNWESQGYEHARINEWANRVHASASRQVEVMKLPNNVMPRPKKQHQKKSETLYDWIRQRFEQRFVLFSLATRRYLRRRTWRYFRNLGATDPIRYVTAAAKFLTRYRDADIDSDIHLLDNWGLVNALFYNCPALRRPAKGWEFVPERGLTDLAFAPRMEPAWVQKPELVFNLMLEANCRTVRLFAVWLLQNSLREWFQKLPIATILKLIDNADPEVADLGFTILEAHADLSSVPVEEWLRRLDGDDLEKLTRLSKLLVVHLDPQRVTTLDAIRLTAYRSYPVANLGFTLLKSKQLGPDDTAALLPLVQAECDSLRPDIASWLRDQLKGFGQVTAALLLEFLDSKHGDVRLIGWNWFMESPLKEDIGIWQKIMESPYTDVRSRLCEVLSDRIKGADPDTLRLLWATVLCSIHGGSRQKPGVVTQIVKRIEHHQEEAPKLFPLLAVAVRSLRGPEFRAGLSGLLMLGETKPQLLPMIQQQFPELVL